MTPRANTEIRMTTKTYQSVLPAATPKKCREEKTKAQIESKLSDIFKNGFWYCLDCEGRCERIEGEQGQPSHCDKCGSPRIRWNEPIWTALIDNTVHDTDLIHPGEL
jgi:hypothetical protein